MRSIATATLALFLFFYGVSPVGASGEDSALQFVQVNVNKVLDILRSCKSGTNCTKEQKRHKLSKLADELFDFRDISRRALGRNVRRFKEEEFQRFVQLFSTMLKNYYINKIDDYSDEKVVFDKEMRLSEEKYQVNTRVIMSDKEIPIVYKLARKDGKWRVYDVLIEGVSMVKNYRSQFDQILKRKKPSYVLALLEKKNAKSVYK